MPASASGVPSGPARRVGPALSALLLLLTVFGPFSMDLYLPVLPQLTRELDAPAALSQLTVTACLLGLGAGQVLAGPLSDRFGRRRPLLVGIVLYVAASALCALAPGVLTLVVARAVQGLAGSVGIVTAQAAGRDLYDGPRLVRYYGRLIGLGGLAAIVGPVVGGQLARVTDWRGVFLVLAGVGVALLLASLLAFTETLPATRRTVGGLRASLHNLAGLLRDRSFLGLVLMMGFLHAALFSYVSDATFVLQGIYGLSPQGYSYAFGLNSLGVVLFSQLSGRLAARFSERVMLGAGIALAGLGALGLLAEGLGHLGLPVVIVSLFALVAGISTCAPQITALGLARYPDMSGTAASLLGLARYGFGGAAAPLAGLGGGTSVLPLGLVCSASVLVAVLVAWTMGGGRSPAARADGANAAT